MIGKIFAGRENLLTGVQDVPSPSNDRIPELRSAAANDCFDLIDISVNISTDDIKRYLLDAALQADQMARLGLSP